MRKIWAHTLVRNEEKWMWFSVMSVIDYVDRVLLWDMESEDDTPKIANWIKSKYPDKVDFRKVPKVNSEGFSKVRQQMLDETRSDWFLVVDGDEIWWDGSIGRLRKVIDSKAAQNKESIVVPIVNLVGDIFHYQEEAAGRYSLAGKRGHYALRGINRNIPGLSSSKPHGTWGWTDKDGKMIQDRDLNKILFVDTPYLHATHLPRAGTLKYDKQVIKRSQKLKYEIGESFPRDYYYPEVLFRKKPDVVPTPWKVMKKAFYYQALFETPLRKLKRRLFKGRVGY